MPSPAVTPKSALEAAGHGHAGACAANAHAPCSSHASKTAHFRRRPTSAISALTEFARSGNSGALLALGVALAATSTLNSLDLGYCGSYEASDSSSKTPLPWPGPRAQTLQGYVIMFAIFSTA